MVTLEKIDLVVERTGVTYEVAKMALEQSEGNVIEAIILIQNDFQNTASGEGKGMRSSDIIETLKEFIRKGNVSRIIITDKDTTLLNIPVTFGALGVILAPVIAVLGVGTLLVTNINISIQDHNGKIIDINKETSDRLSKFKSKGAKTKEAAEKKAEEYKNKFDETVDVLEEEFEELIDHFKTKKQTSDSMEVDAEVVNSNDQDNQVSSEEQ